MASLLSSKNNVPTKQRFRLTDIVKFHIQPSTFTYLLYFYLTFLLKSLPASTYLPLRNRNNKTLFIKGHIFPTAKGKHLTRMKTFRCRDMLWYAILWQCVTHEAFATLCSIRMLGIWERNINVRDWNGIAVGLMAILKSSAYFRFTKEVLENS